MLTFVCWKWKPYTDFACQKFTAEHVNTLSRMVSRHYNADHRFVCFTDDPEGINESVEVYPIWDHHAEVPNPMGDGYPRCYRRLYAFSEEFARVFDDPFVSLDLDCVVVDDITDLMDVSEDVKFWSHAVRGQNYNGSMWFHRPGTRTQVWEDFDPMFSPQEVRAAGFRGSDQAWFNFILPNEAVWTTEDGVYNWDSHMRRRNYRLPPDARIVFFCGQTNPWDDIAQERAGWIRDYYR